MYFVCKEPQLSSITIAIKSKRGVVGLNLMQQLQQARHPPPPLRRPQASPNYIKCNKVHCALWFILQRDLNLLPNCNWFKLPCRQKLGATRIKKHNFKFLPDPGVSGVRSMGPGVSIYVTPSGTLWNFADVTLADDINSIRLMIPI